METKLLSEVHKVLRGFSEYWEEDKLLKHKLIEDIRAYNEKIIEALLSNELIRDTYSISLQSGLVFKTEDFISMLRYKNYWDNSYTKFTNEVGLTNEGKYLKYNTDVVLDFPHKDSVLEGGMTKEEVGKKEIYYHNVIAKEEIDTLLTPKTLFPIKRYNQKEEERVKSFSKQENLVLKGNNLIALHSLKEIYAERVKLIYIDPPYNTGGDSFKYNDKFNHSSWLTFMKNRLEVAKDLLAHNGSVWINIDDDESHYLKVLCDEIFGRENFVSNIVWEKKYTISNDSKWLSDNHDHILVYAKNKSHWYPNPLPRTEKMNNAYKNPDNHPKGVWKSTPLHAKSGSENARHFSYTFENGVTFRPPSGTFSRFSKETLKALDENDEIWFGKDGKATPSKKTFLSELKNQGTPSQTLWRFDEVGHNHEAREETKNLMTEEIFSTPKPERLLKRIIHLASKEEDIVLDFFMGSATTQAVSHKMNRQYIGIEQMNYIEDVSVPRLKKVIEGEQGGISEDVKWRGGGNFVYAKLYSLNEEFLHEIQLCRDEIELENALKRMKESAYLNFKVDLERVTADNTNFQVLSLDEKKNVLIQVLDMNQLYLNYSEINDSQYNISDAVKAFNRSFYQKEGEKDE